VTDRKDLVDCPSTFFLGLTGITLPAIAVPGLQIGPRLKVINDPPAAGRMLAAYADNLGLLEYDFLTRKAPALAYVQERVQIDPAAPGEWINALLLQRLSEMQSILLRLWLIKDNAVDPDIGWMAVKFGDGTIVNNNRWSGAYSKAGGTSEPTAFSRDELRAATTWKIDPQEMPEGRGVPLYRAGASEDRITKLSQSTLRIQRFLYFVDGARKSRDVAIKIVLYCSGLEAMLSSSNTELTHQVAERAAVLISDRGEARLDAYQQVKAAYAIRSKAVHGAMFRDKDHHKLVTASIGIDEICRKVARGYFSSVELAQVLESDQDAFTEFWLGKLFT
jgi:hypothetical protein